MRRARAAAESTAAWSPFSLTSTSAAARPRRSASISPPFRSTAPVKTLPRAPARGGGLEKYARSGGAPYSSASRPIVFTIHVQEARLSLPPAPLWLPARRAARSTRGAAATLRGATRSTAADWACPMRAFAASRDAAISRIQNRMSVLREPQSCVRGAGAVYIPGGAERAQERSRAVPRRRQRARTCGGPNRPAEGSVRSTTRAGTFCLRVATTAHDVRGAGGRRPRRCGACPEALAGGAEALPRGARTFGGPNRRVERSVRPLESVHWGTQAGGFRVQHSPNVPALGGTASSDVRIFPAQRASRSGPRRAPGGNTPPPCAFSLSALTPKGLLHQARLSLLIQQ